MADVLIALGALVLLIAAAYRGFSVILFAPLAAMLAVLLTDPAAVPAAFSGLFMDKVATFLKLYFPVFLLGAVFGRLIEISGFSRALVGSVLQVMGPQRAMPAIVLVCALLTYGGVSLFVVVVESAQAAGISAEVLHRVAAMSSGGMDTLPHNGPVITLLAVTGLTHRQSYRNIFAITCIKTAAVAVVIVVYYLTGLR